MPIYYKQLYQIDEERRHIFLELCKLNNYHIAEAWIKKGSEKCSFYGTQTMTTTTNSYFYFNQT